MESRGIQELLQVTDDITEGYASLSGITTGNIQSEAVGNIWNDPITKSAYDTCCRNVLPAGEFNTSIYAATTPNSSSEAIYNSLQRPEIERK